MAMETTLYTAATMAIASDETAENTFKSMCEAASHYPTIIDFKFDLNETEKTIKKEFELKSMPNPWRSAKSVIISAITLGIKLKDDNNNLKGKTALQNEIKSYKETPAIPYDIAQLAVNKLAKIWSKLDSAEKVIISARLEAFKGC